MAVLTSLDDADVRELLAAHGLGGPARVEGIAAGSVNSNFAVVVGDARAFLRLYEERGRDEAERETQVLVRLARAGVPTPAPMQRTDGALVSMVRGKPAALFPWCEGRMRCQAGVGERDAHRVGEALARLHVAGGREPCDAGRFRYDDLVARLDRIEASGDARFAPELPRLRDSLARTHAARDRSLPRGLVHSDLFRDNVLWDEEGRVAALLDFESACDDTYAYDLMVTVLSWCFADDLDARLARAMRAGYESVRPLSVAETRALHVEGEMASLRFTITRITDYAMRTGAAGPRVVKDWRRFLRRFERLESLGEGGLREMLSAS